MSTQRRRYSAEFNARVALDAIKGHKTSHELASLYGVHPTQITHWNHQLEQEVAQIFSARRAKREPAQDALQAQLYQQIGQLKVELDWLKKKRAVSSEAKRALSEPEHPQRRVARQCALLGLARSSLYDRSSGERAENLRLMRLWAEQYTRTPFDGVRRMTVWLRQQGYPVNPKRVVRLLRTMGLETISPQPRTSQPQPAHRVYPYLLRGVPITRVHQVWSTEITYVRLHGGFIYLVVVLEWFSRSVRSWAVSISLDVGCCLEALEQALAVATPHRLNSDQGAQCTSLEFTGRCAAAGSQSSRDGRGRAMDNIVVERLWRTVNDEEVYLKDYGTPREARQG
jgi:putative transposase